MGQGVVTLVISPKATIFSLKNIKIYPVPAEQLMQKTSGVT